MIGQENYLNGNIDVFNLIHGGLEIPYNRKYWQIIFDGLLENEAKL